MTLYKKSIRDDRVREYVPVVRTVMSEGFSKPDFFVGRQALQSLNTLTDADQINVKKGAYILLDFGMELHGGIRIVTGGGGRGKVRVRFGESVSEAMQTPNQDHSIHDAELEVPMMGMMEYGCTGFRFVRIDILADQLNLINVIAVALYRDLERGGSFESSDPLLNKIWDTGVYTVQLNMQDYIYDGIKRDRLVWLGDLNPEIRVILSAFSDASLIPKSLDFLRDHTPLPHYMNGIITYSAWWVVNQYDYFMHIGDLEYLKLQKDYLVGLVR
ncbi:MAG: alpha-L-rhamnosidase, partial [Lentisphaeria bacterium]|nr:alpha-L-rhamnosidase [Lentisphaeria bacterium]